MNVEEEGFYAAWRELGTEANALRETGAVPPEKLLQAVWQHQRIRRDDLKTSDGRSLRIFHPGFVSTEGGPDFRGAVLKMGDTAPVSGDVEVDLLPGGWHAHGHDRNPAFANVILHVVWEAPAHPHGSYPLGPTLLPLQNLLDAPLAELALALENSSDLPAPLRGRCAMPLQRLSATAIATLLREAARVRFQNKAQAILARAKCAGWEQALWEQLLRALGYKHNPWPMQHLAEGKPRWLSGAHSVFELQARLLGCGGLLPGELTRTQMTADAFLRRAWDVWWRERDAFADCTLPRIAWKLHGLRPANHPQRRLALAAHWLASGNLISQIEAWATAEILPSTPTPNSGDREPKAEGSAKLVATLHNIFQVERDEFWSWHWTFKSARMTKAQPLLGEDRVTDLAVNVVLPWLWIRAREGGNETLQRELERRFFAWPAAEDNSVLKLARQRLFGGIPMLKMKRAAEQQGCLQILRDFCERSNAVCDGCRFPELLQTRI